MSGRRIVLMAFAIFALAGCTNMKSGGGEEAGAGKKISTADVPAPVMRALNDRFPGNTVTSVEKETENGNVVYDFELKMNARKYESDIKEDGTIMEIEKQVMNVPASITESVKAKYPNAKIGDVMEVNRVKGKTETPDHYEVTMTDRGKEKEVNVSLDGKTVSTEAAE